MQRSTLVAFITWSAVAAAGIEAAVPATGNPLGNALKDMPGQVKRSIRQFRTGCGVMWQNGKDARAIKRTVQHDGHQLSYADLLLLRRDKEDFAKFLQAGFVWFAVPELFPFYLISFPRSAPSAFESDEQRAKKRATLVRMRTRGALDFLTTLEEQAAGGGGISFRPALRTTAAIASCELAEQLLQSRSVSQALVYVQSSAATPDPKAKAFKALQRITKAEERRSPKQRVGRITGAGKIALDGLSQPALKTGCTIIGSSGPKLGMMRRGALGKHLENLVVEDSALAAQGLETLSRDELLEACIDRGFGSIRMSEPRLRKLLKEWLDVGAAREVGGAYEPHRLRLAMMATFAAGAVRREEDSMSVLPRLAYA